MKNFWGMLSVVVVALIVSGCTGMVVQTKKNTTASTATADLCPSGSLVSGDFQSGSGTAGSPYVICNLNQLDHFVTYCTVTAASNCLGLEFKLGADIDLTAQTYNPPQLFRGTFNGNSKTVSNWTYAAADLGDNAATIEADIGNPTPHTDFNLGFFRVLGDGAYVKNLNLTNVSLKGRFLTGALAGLASAGSTVDTCTATTSGVAGDVTTAMTGIIIGFNDLVTGGTSGHTGGLIGQTEATAVVTGSSFSGLVRGAMHVGGLVGEAYGPIIGSSTAGAVFGRDGNEGGITGNLTGASAVITTSHSSMLVHTTSTAIGGIAGSLNGGSFVTTSYFTGSMTGGSIMGGIAGYTGGGATISKSYSTGTITGGQLLGGLVGWMVDPGDNVSDSYSRMNITNSGTGMWGMNAASGGAVGYMGASSSLMRVYSACTITDSAGTINKGDLVAGAANGSVITRSFADENNITTGLVGAGAGTPTNNASSSLTTANAKLQASYTGWDFTSVWQISGAVNNGYPTLR